jgi:CheY-like chemotaxis protein
LCIETSLIDIRDDFGAPSFGVNPGRYVALSVTDTGSGMTPEVQARLFEPFFTTKEPRKGTGLGLSTVYGIVKQSGASITVHSTEGLGTSFRVLFPAVEDQWTAEKEAEPDGDGSGSETVLVVEDEVGVRNYVREVLEAHGYRALDAARGEDAMEIARYYRGVIHLLITDVVLPGMKGTEVVKQFREIRPGVPVLRMSGYPERFGPLTDDRIPMLQKPFSQERLLRQIRRILDEEAAGSAD